MYVKVLTMTEALTRGREVDAKTIPVEKSDERLGEAMKQQKTGDRCC